MNKVKNILKISNKKVLFITSTEQNALKYSTDFSRLFDLNSDILPYQNTSPYDTLNVNLYDYQKQISVLQTQNNLIIAPIKVFSEKFPTLSFFEENKLALKIGDSITQKELLKKLTQFGYKRATMVSDIGEFSIRGDITDVYTLNDAPIRIEFWGDEIDSIRFFDVEDSKIYRKN